MQLHFRWHKNNVVLISLHWNLLLNSHTSSLHHFRHLLAFLNPWRRTWQQAKQWQEEHMYSMAVSYFEHQSTYFLSERKQLDVFDIIRGNVFQSLSLFREKTYDKRKRVFLKFSYLSTTTTTTAMKTTQHCIALHCTARTPQRSTAVQHFTTQRSTEQHNTGQHTRIHNTDQDQENRCRLLTDWKDTAGCPERFRSKLREITGRAKY